MTRKSIGIRPKGNMKYLGGLSTLFSFSEVLQRDPRNIYVNTRNMSSFKQLDSSPVTDYEQTIGYVTNLINGQLAPLVNPITYLPTPAALIANFDTVRVEANTPIHIFIDNHEGTTYYLNTVTEAVDLPFQLELVQNMRVIYLFGKYKPREIEQVKNILALDQGYEVPTFNTRHLFLKGEQGIWLDPNDLSTMFQDAAGTPPVTDVGQPVGLVLDKSKGLVLEHILTNSNDFTLSSDKWTVGSNVQFSLNPANGAAKLTFAGGHSNIINHFGYGPFRSNLREMFEISFDAKHISGVDMVVGLGYGYARTVSAAENGGGVRRYSFRIFNNAGGLNRAIIFSGTSSNEAVWEISNVSTACVTGSHSLQNTSAARPLLQNDIKFDGIDDALNIAFPSALTNCTIFTVKHGQQAQILDAQSVAQNHIINQDFKYYGIVNRALTSSERAGLTRFLNKLGAQ